MATPTRGLPAAGPPTPQLTPGTRDTFAREVLNGLGAPATDENVAFMLAWFAREGTSAAFNPMATTMPMPGATNLSGNSAGVKNYANEASGVAATVKTLQNGLYSGIVADLKRGNTKGAATGHPEEFSKWSGGGYTSINYGGVGDTIGGSGSVAGGGTGAGSGAALPANATPQQLETYVRDNWPEMAGYLNIPEIRAILIDEAQKKGTAGELEARVYATQWWKTNGANARSYFTTQTVDPATHEEDVRAKMAELAPDVAKLGLDLDLRVYAENALKYGWSTAQTAADEATRLRMQSSATGLKPGSSPAQEADNLAQIATSEYYVPLSRQDAEKWSINIFEGRSTEAQFRDYLEGQAEGRFPGLKSQNITPGMYMQPIVNTVAQELELNPGDVNLLDPRYSGLIQMKQADGSYAPATISQAQQWARSQPGYVYTHGARDTAAQFSDLLTKTFGKTA